MNLVLKALAAIIGIIVAVAIAVLFRNKPAAPPVLDERWNEGVGVTADTTFRYPRDLALTYVTAAQWPPVVEVKKGLFTCNPTSDEESYQSHTAWRTIGGQAYCVSVAREGAAGSEYDTYGYTTSRDEAVITVSFTVQRPQCANYDEPVQSTCKREQEAFDPDALAALVVSTIRSPLLPQ